MLEKHDGKNSISINVQSVLILGLPVSLIDMDVALETIYSWAAAGKSNYICVRDVHGLMLSIEDPEIMRIHQAAAMVTPDGMPIVWAARRRSGLHVERVCGSDLVEALCNRGLPEGLSHYFYGGKAGTAEKLISNLKEKYRGISIAGYHSPPFRPLLEEEDAEVVRQINKSGANIVWVGLSTPKQELWMRDHVNLIRGATLIGVGAAFDFHAGIVKRAPKWMQKTGFEWLHRLASEPRRLWRRYLVVAPKFLIKYISEELALALRSTTRDPFLRKFNRHADGSDYAAAVERSRAQSAPLGAQVFDSLRPAETPRADQ